MRRKIMDNQEALLEFARNAKSQGGEDGVLIEIFRRIGVKHKWCCEFGAWDGEHLSNSWLWINKARWAAVLLEMDPDTYLELNSNYLLRDDVHCLPEYLTKENPLDGVLAKTPIPADFDLLVVDVDGCDYWIWKSLENYRPRVVVIEINSSMPPSLHFVQKHDPRIFIGSSLRAMTKLANEKGYELAACLGGNAVYVVSEDFPKLGIEDNSVESLFNSPYVPIVISDQVGRHYVLRVGSYGITKEEPQNPGKFFEVSLGAPEYVEEIEVVLSHKEEKVAEIMRQGWKTDGTAEQRIRVNTFDKKPE
jgi:hypothetical protein